MKDQPMKKIRPFAVAVCFAVSAAHATLVHEKFAADPALDGWQVFGSTNLFQWNSTNQMLDVTWDSSQTNSYFYHPLGAALTKADSFCVLFDLQMSDAVVTQDGNQVAVGLFHFSDATQPDFNRANSPLPNLFEFDYFPAFNYDGYASPDTVDATLKDAQAGYAGLYWLSDPLTLNPGTTYRVVLIHRAGETVLSGTIYVNGQILSTLPKINDYGPIGDFQLDTLSVSSFTDDGWGDALLAHGSVGNLACASPLPIGAVNAPAAGQVQFASDTNWLYTLEQSADFQTWTAAASATPGNGTNLLLRATNLPADCLYYRVRADLP
jgi:hypothetical protein